MSRTAKQIFTYTCSVALVVILAACYQTPGATSPGGFAKVVVQAHPASTYVPPAVATGPSIVTPAGQHRMTVPTPSEVRVIVRGPDFGRIERTVPPEAREVAMIVPRGQGREFILEYYEANGTLLGGGSIVVTIDGYNQVVYIPVSGGAPGTRVTTVVAGYPFGTVKPITIATCDPREYASGARIQCEVQVLSTATGGVTVTDAGLRIRDASSLTDRSSDFVDALGPGAVPFWVGPNTAFFTVDLELKSGIPGGNVRIDGIIRGEAVDGRRFAVRVAERPHFLEIFAQKTLSTFAGCGTTGTAGDGERATSPAVQLNAPVGLAEDSRGNVYISERDGHTVRRVAPDGFITTVAGTGVVATDPGEGDGGPAALARFQYPSGLAVDARDRVLVADTRANRVRRFTPDGIIETIAGGGSPPTGVGDGLPATQAQLWYPQSVLYDPGTGATYIADTDNNRVRVIDPITGIIDTYAGDGSNVASLPTHDGMLAREVPLCNPVALALNIDGDLLIGHQCPGASRDPGLVWRVDRSSRRIHRVAGSFDQSPEPPDGGLALGASLDRPTGLATDPSGNVYLAEVQAGSPDWGQVRVVTRAGNIVRFAGHRRAAAGDGSPATNFFLSTTGRLLGTASGKLLLGETGFAKVRSLQ